MKATAKATPVDESKTLLDRYRQAGLADRVVNELDRRLKIQTRRRRAALRGASAAIIMLVTALWAVPYFRETSTVAVPAAVQSVFTLPDGSKVELNANSELKTDFRYGRRLVSLDRGEAFFSVRHDPSHPFLVETANGTVRVTGTSFDVRQDHTGNTSVTLVEGHVLLKTAGADVFLAPGQQATLSERPPAARELSPSEMERALAWRRGEIILDGITLGSAAAQFAEFHGCSITVDPSAAQVRLGGTYALKNLSHFLEALQSTGDVHVIPTDNGSYRIVGR